MDGNQIENGQKFDRKWIDNGQKIDDGYVYGSLLFVLYLCVQIKLYFVIVLTKEVS